MNRREVADYLAALTDDEYTQLVTESRGTPPKPNTPDVRGTPHRLATAFDDMYAQEDRK